MAHQESLQMWLKSEDDGTMASTHGMRRWLVDSKLGPDMAGAFGNRRPDASADWP